MSREMRFWDKKRDDMSPAERRLLDFVVDIAELGVYIAEDVKASKVVNKAKRISIQTQGAVKAFRDELRQQRKDR